MKSLVKVVGTLGLLFAVASNAQQLNSVAKNTESKLIHAVGDGYVGRAVGQALCSFKDTVLTAAQVDALNATPIVLVPAPGAGKTLRFCGATAWLNYGGTAWAGSSETLVLKSGTGGATLATLPEATFVELTRDAVMHVGESNTPYEVQDNAAIYATANADFTTGNSPISLRVFYRTVGSSLILAD